MAVEQVRSINLMADQDTAEDVAARIAAMRVMQGSVLITNVSVDFNLKTGEASAIENNGTGVQIEFNFNHIEVLINSAMSLLAKRELLQKLHALNDESINNCVKQDINQLDLRAIDNALVQIAKLGVAKHGFGVFNPIQPKPLHIEVYKAIGDITSIKSMDRVDTIMQSIRAVSLTPRYEQR